MFKSKKDCKTDSRCGSRRRRRRILPFLVLPVLGVGLLGVAAAGTTAFKHGCRFHGPGFPGGPEAHRAHMENAVDDILDEIDASDEQAAQVDAIMEGAFEQAMHLHEGHDEHHAQLKALLVAETIDRQALEDLRQEALVKLDEGTLLLLNTVADVAEVLSQEQRLELAELAESRHGR